MRSSGIPLLAALLAAAPLHAEEEELDCLLAPAEQVSLSAPTAGRIARILVARGESVQAGQLLVELESGVAKANLEIARMRAGASADLDAARLRLDYADTAHGRSVKLASNHVISSQELDQATSSRELAAAAMRRAEEDRSAARLEYARMQAALEERRVTSPLNALVTARHHDVGEFVEGQPILELAQIDPLHVEVFVPARLWGRIAVGQEARVHPEQPVGGEHAARVSLVDPVVDSRSGTFAVQLDLPNPDHALPAGIGCRVRFALAPRPAVQASR